MIKVIHYCWFGGKKKPRVIRKCIKSWKKHFPGFEIKEWNETNFDVNCCKYVQEAYSQKMYAFVADYCRFYALYKYGGFYLDTDVKVLKSFYDNIKTPFLAIEKSDNYEINPGLCCYFEKKDQFCLDVLNQYKNESFNKKTICTRTTEYFDKLGYIRIDEDQIINGYTIYSSDRFCPIDYRNYRDYSNKDTFAKHLYIATWARGKVRLKIRYLRFAAIVKNILKAW